MDTIKTFSRYSRKYFLANILEMASELKLPKTVFSSDINNFKLAELPHICFKRLIPLCTFFDNVP